MKQVIHFKCNIFFYFISPRPSSSSWTQTLDFGMMRLVLYHCGRPLANIKKMFLIQWLSYYTILILD